MELACKEEEDWSPDPYCAVSKVNSVSGLEFHQHSRTLTMNAPRREGWRKGKKRKGKEKGKRREGHSVSLGTRAGCFVRTSVSNFLVFCFV
jgi:hypothetical protein